MTREELLKELEPFTIKYKNGELDVMSSVTMGLLIQQWLRKGEHESIDDAFDIWNDTIAELVKKHDIRAPEKRH